MAMIEHSRVRLRQVEPGSAIATSLGMDTVKLIWRSDLGDISVETEAQRDHEILQGLDIGKNQSITITIDRNEAG